MSKPSIKLSPKNGINPTIGICAWCGKETGELILLGKLPKDEEAPMHSVINYEPCDACKEAWGSAVMFFETVTEQPSDNRPPISTQNGQNLYPTLRHVGITPDAAARAGLPNDPGGKILIDKSDFEKLFANVI